MTEYCKGDSRTHWGHWRNNIDMSAYERIAAEDTNTTDDSLIVIVITCVVLSSSHRESSFSIFLQNPHNQIKTCMGACRLLLGIDLPQFGQSYAASDKAPHKTRTLLQHWCCAMLLRLYCDIAALQRANRQTGFFCVFFISYTHVAVDRKMVCINIVDVWLCEAIYIVWKHSNPNLRNALGTLPKPPQKRHTAEIKYIDPRCYAHVILYDRVWSQLRFVCTTACSISSGTLLYLLWYIFVGGMHLVHKCIHFIFTFSPSWCCAFLFLGGNQL